MKNDRWTRRSDPRVWVGSLLQYPGSPTRTLEIVSYPGADAVTGIRRTYAITHERVLNPFGGYDNKTRRDETPEDVTVMLDEVAKMTCLKSGTMPEDHKEAVLSALPQSPIVRLLERGDHTRIAHDGRRTLCKRIIDAGFDQHDRWILIETKANCLAVENYPSYALPPYERELHGHDVDGHDCTAVVWLSSIASIVTRPKIMALGGNRA